MSCRGCFFRGFGLFETRLRKDRNQNYMIKSQYPLNRLPLHSRLYIRSGANLTNTTKPIPGMS